jgi:hypothetical protein
MPQRFPIARALSRTTLALTRTTAPTSGFVCDFGNHLFVTDDRTRIPPGSMFASLDRTLLKCASKALISADDQHLVGAPWISPFRCGQFPQAFSPCRISQVRSNEVSNWCHYSRT